MFTRKQPRLEEYEMVDQSVPREHDTLSESVSTPAEGLLPQSRNSADSETSEIFDDLENYSAGSGQKIDDFYDSPIFQTIFNRYTNKGFNPKACWIVSLCVLILWVGSLILYSRVNPSNIISNLRWKTSIVQLNGENITINEYSPSYKNLSLHDWRTGKYYTSEKQIRWLTPHQNPKIKLGSGFYTVNEHGKIVIQQVNSDSKDVLVSSSRFAYGNEFFEIQDFILNPKNSAEELDNTHILITDKLEQWRQLSFALYWLFNPLTFMYTPIQPPESKEKLENQKDPFAPRVLQKLHFADFSPDGKFVYFGFEHNLYIQDLSDNKIHQLTTDGSPDIFNGKSDWVYEEEVNAKDRMIWWSPNSARFVFAKINDTDVKEVELDYYTKESTKVGTQYEQLDESEVEGVNQYPIKTSLKYPKPGTANPIVSLYVYDVKTKEVKPLNDDDDTLGPDRIIYDAKWIDSKNFLMKQTDRTSSILSKKLYQPETNEVRVINSTNVTTAYSGWVEKMSPMTRLSDGKYIDTIVVDSRNVLALFDSLDLATPLKILTENQNWEVIGSAVYDKQEKFIYFLSTIKSSMDSHLLGIDMADNYKIYNITNTTRDAYYDVDFSVDGQFLNLKYQGPDQPWQRLIDMGDIHDYIKSEEFDASRIEEEVILKQPIISGRPDLRNINIPTVRYKEIAIGNPKDEVSLNVMEILPPNFKPTKYKYPVFVHTYGGPGSQNVFKKFDIGFLQIISAKLNCIVLVIDPRGTGGKGWKFRSYANNKLGYWEPRDLTLVTSEYIKRNQDIINQDRVALWGWSYGGFVTLKTLEYDKGETFKYGMAVAPVTNWLFYDSIYTERYMNGPSENPNYEAFARINEIENFKSLKRFLVMHGTGDDNVHVQNLMWLLDKFNAGNVENYDVHFFPDSDHSIQYDNAGIIVFDKLYNWLEDAFKGRFDKLV
ncbi:Dipeptidyl aminopeptidase A [Candida viswanathii]|uniref:Dipeptidyl aminopeptidase A n=1 Tax=Candida viswanathii TaxID=5486 RepID=A0A367YA37_9ASCO|nr:Dipeptidyl aminopeptidase A [Candida viswanathii]